MKAWGHLDNPRWRRVCNAVAVAAFALVASAIGQVDEIGAQDPSPGICAVTPPEAESSRTWLPDNPVFTRVAEYGKSSEQWIGSYGGLAVHDDEVFVFDHGKPEMLVLSASALHVVRRFGREGEGPGEFKASTRPWGIGRHFTFGFLAVAGVGLAVYDGRGVELFDLSGRHTGSARGLPTFPLFGVRYLGAVGPEDTFLYAADRLRRGPPRRRSFQTWTLEDGPGRQLWEVPLVFPPTHDSGISVPATQANPLWTIWGNCVLMADGATDQILRLDLATGVTDSVALPSWPLPSAGSDADRRIPGLPGSGARPTARMRWEDMNVDPQGFIWVQLWSDDPDKPARVAVVNPNDGSFRDVTAPLFPRAFGPSDSFFAVERGPAHEAYIVKYVVTNED